MFFYIVRALKYVYFFKVVSNTNMKFILFSTELSDIEIQKEENAENGLVEFLSSSIDNIV